MEGATVSKLTVILRQWKEIEAKELGYSEDLRHHDDLAQAQEMIAKVEQMIREIS